MYVMLLVMLCMLVMMVIIRIIANSLTKRRLISMFDFRLANGKSEITGEYRDAIQEKDIDEQVIDDLEMREVFARVDFTYSCLLYTSNEYCQDCLLFDTHIYDDVDVMCSTIAAGYIVDLIYGILISRD